MLNVIPIGKLLIRDIRVYGHGSTYTITYIYFVCIGTRELQWYKYLVLYDISFLSLLR